MEISIREIDKETYQQAMKLQTTPEQARFVEPPSEWLAEAHFKPGWRVWGIMAGDKVVGLIMDGLEEATGRWWVKRLMVDATEQGRGYAGAGVQQLIFELTENSTAKALYAKHDADNEQARRLASKLGFAETGEEDGRMVARLDLPQRGFPEPNITLRDVTLENARECIRLKVAPGQERFVASNAASLVQSKFEPYWLTKAIYNDDTMVGFVMYGYEAEFGWFVTRVMVDARYQGRGYGRGAMQRIIEHVKSEGGALLGISYEADNEPARQLYSSLGFVETGEAPYGEPLAVLRMQAE